MNRWDERYASSGYHYGTAPNEFLRSVADRIPRHGRVLCLAAGEGRNAVYLAALGHRVTAVDASGIGLSKARALAEQEGVELTTVHSDLADFVVQPSSWNGIVSIFAHLPPGLRATVHRAAVAGLRPGGVFLLEAYTPEQLSLGTGGPPTRELMMTLDALRRELHGLDLEVAREIRRAVLEGRGHRGDAAVVQIVGRKRSDASLTDRPMRW